MRKLGLGTIVLYLLTAVSGGSATVSAQGKGSAKAQSKQSQPKKTSICHLDEASGIWDLISIGTPAVSAHFRNHDDGLPNGTTTRSGTALDGNCDVVPTPSFECPATDVAGFPLEVHDDTLFCSYPAVPGEDPNDFFCRYDPLTGALVLDNDAGLCPASAVPVP